MSYRAEMIDLLSTDNHYVDSEYAGKVLDVYIEEVIARAEQAAQERILNELEEWAEPLFDRAGVNANAIGAIPISVIKAKRQSLKEKES